MIEERDDFGASSEVRDLTIINLEELEKEAGAVLPKGPFGYVSGGSGDEITLLANVHDFDELRIVPRYLTGLDEPDISTSLLGTRLDAPLFCPPMAAHGLVHDSAEAGSARGWAESGCLFTMTTLSNTSLRQVAAASASGPKWFQLYFAADPGVNRQMLAEAKAAGATAIVFSVDLERPGNREADMRNHFHFPASLNFPNVPGARPGQSLREITDVFKQGLDWNDLEFIRRESGLPVIVKGLLSPEDAREAVERGASAVGVSNHGGRQLDGVPSAISALPRIVDVVEGRVPVLLDGGVRRGIHVLEALALGASAVAVGRPTLYGLALGGWRGVHSMVEALKREFSLAMKLAGLKQVGDIGLHVLEDDRVRIAGPR